MKKVIVLVVFILAAISLSSCRSTKDVCTTTNTQEILQTPQQNRAIACLEME